MKRRTGEVKLVAFVGPSGVGKTRLLVRLVSALTRRGLRVAAIKHSHHQGFDKPGSDSSKLREAGALGVALMGRSELAWFGPPLEDPRSLAPLFVGADVVLCEGFKHSDLPRIEVHRRPVSRRFLADSDPAILAVVSDDTPRRALPRFKPGQVQALADWLCERWSLGNKRKKAAGEKS
ncbi:MAG: molybdopterin-guanine dinucleotide biosynthesis protein B [Myxococcales bacterium]